VWHLFVVRHPQRDALQQHLKQEGIGTLIHYPIPPHISGAYAGQGWQAGAFPISERLARQVLSLPCGPHLSAEQVGYIMHSIQQFPGG
jgi:dTDP-4-amino-4,6-dideoxygalactose transaminase